MWENDFKDIVNDNLDMFEMLTRLSSKKPVHFVKGNHDPTVEELKRLLPDLIFAGRLDNNRDSEYSRYYGTQFEKGIVLHGEMFDDLVAKYLWFSKFLFMFQKFFERVFRFNIQEFLREYFFSVSNKSDKEYFLDLIGDIEDATISKYQGVYPFLIMGHTHYPKHITFDQNVNGANKFTYINCGDWISNHTYVTHNDNDGFILHR